MIITDNPHWANRLNRRIFLGGGLAGILGSTAVGGLRAEGNKENESSPDAPWINPGVPKAKRIIYLFQSGAPSQMDLFDPKPVIDRKSVV